MKLKKLQEEALYNLALGNSSLVKAPQAHALENKGLLLRETLNVPGYQFRWRLSKAGSAEFQKRFI